MSPDILAMLWKMSLQAAVLAAVVWLICRLARKAPALWRCALWLLVIVKLFIPPFAYVPAQSAFWQHPEPALTQRVVTSENTPRAASMVPQASPAVPVAPRPANEEPAAQPPIDPSRVLVFIWLGGVLAMAGLTALRFSRQRRLVDGSTSASDELSAMLAECAERMGVHRLPRIRLSPDTQTPMLVGVLCPVILLHEEILSSCGESSLRAMLLHELAHVQRLDMAVLWLQQLAQALFFFHPAVWFAGREMRRERELACDELVLSRAGIAPKDYAAGYVAALKLANGRPAVATSLAMAEPFDVEKRRLQGILERPVPKLSVPWLVAGLLIVALGLPTLVGCAEPAAHGVTAYLPAAKITSMHSIGSFSSPSSASVRTEMWMVLPDKRRVDSGNHTFVDDGHTLWGLDKVSRRYTVTHYSHAPFAPDVEKYSDPAEIERGWRGSGSVIRKHVRKELHGVEQDAIELDVTAKSSVTWFGNATVTMILDPQTQRVKFIEFRIYDKVSGELKRTQTDENEYNTAIDPALFNFTPPAGAMIDSEKTESTPPGNVTTSEGSYPPTTKVTSIHTTVTRHLAAGREWKNETWTVLPDKRRMECAELLFVYDGHDKWHLDKKSNHYTRFHYPRTPPPLDVDAWSTPAGIEKRWRHQGKVVRKSVHKELNGILQDGIELDVTLAEPSSFRQASVMMFLDPITKRLKTVTTEFRDGSEVVRSETDEYEYDIAIDPALFRFHPPAGAVRDSEVTKP